MEALTFSQVSTRQTALILISAGHDSDKIAKLLKVTKQFVWTVKQGLISSNYDNQTFAENKDHSHQYDTIRDRDFIMRVQEMVDNNPSKSTWRPTLRS